MYYDFKVKIPKVKGKIYERTIKGGVYINYEYDRIYIAFCAAEQTLIAGKHYKPLDNLTNYALI